MIAPLRLFQQLEMLVEGFLRLPGGAVDTLHAGVRLITTPVGGRATGEPEGRDVLGGGDMRAAAQVEPFPFPGAGIQVVVGG
ncbi:Uncharacterised protein [Mycobacteroides abscessus subsp. abscessus]|nr:Uncharacterised protein [Mycobacteroides abscessus subsp. abscessus]SLC85256.1 Uncharacterised protein [Mycobacteroides abscessus subsp. massiliense]